MRTRPSREPATHASSRRWATTLLVAAIAVVVVRTAWMSDDAYITLRTVDNWVNGRGLVWNTAERVQTYTHPLWMLLLSAAYFVTREAYLTTLALSIAVSLAAVAVFGLAIAPSTRSALIGGAVLVLSPSFIDYSTSGLESPLLHLILALFLAEYLRDASPLPRTRVLRLSLLTALAGLTRPDALVLLGPPLAAATWASRGFRTALAGLTPLAAWLAFSLLYYGFPFPNTAYAKLNTGLTAAELWPQGIAYATNFLRGDPLAWAAVVVGPIVVALRGSRRELAVAAGIALHLAYVVRVGGDFMSGRFFTPALFATVCLLSRVRVASPRAAVWTLVAGIAALGALTGRRLPALSGPDFGIVSGEAWGRSHVDAHGIGDERAFYYQGTGLLRANGAFEAPDGHPWASMGRHLRTIGARAALRQNIGLHGYYAGPTVHVIDMLALGDPLLARLHMAPGTPWRIGEFLRPVPCGYVETIQTGRNLIRDAGVAEYYDRLTIVTRGRLLDARRLAEIWRLNTGQHDHLVARYPGEADCPEEQVPGPRASAAEAEEDRPPRGVERRPALLNAAGGPPTDVRGDDDEARGRACVVAPQPQLTRKDRHRVASPEAVVFRSEGQGHFALEHQGEFLARVAAGVLSALASRIESYQQGLETRRRVREAEPLDLGARPSAAEGLPLGNPHDEPTLSIVGGGEELRQRDAQCRGDLLHGADGRRDLTVLDL
jgi:arabinofuranosyltransferase